MKYVQFCRNSLGVLKHLMCSLYFSRIKSEEIVIKFDLIKYKTVNKNKN